MVSEVSEYLSVIGEELPLRIPMVSFTDLPKRIRGKHVMHYGGYGIAFPKDLLTKKGVCPVVYLVKNGRLTKSLRSCKAKMTETQYRSLLAYVKPNLGEFVDKESGAVSKRRFYDEREWRYVPTWWINGEEPPKTKEYLSFKLEDIRKVFVRTKEEKAELKNLYPALEIETI